MKNKVTITFATEEDAAQFIGACEYERTQGQSALMRSIAGSSIQRSMSVEGQLTIKEAKQIRLNGPGLPKNKNNECKRCGDPLEGGAKTLCLQCQEESTPEIANICEREDYDL